MPQCTWEKIAQVKHALSQERTIICGVRLRLEKVQPTLTEEQSKAADIIETLNRLQIVDKRLKELEDELIVLIEEADNGLQ